MSMMSRAWIKAQIEHELERGNTPDAVRDLAALVTVHNYLCDQEGADMRQYGRRYDPNRMHMPRGESRDMQRGHAEDAEDGKLTREEAEKWVKGMKSEDGKNGPRWSFDQINQYAGNFGIQGEENVIEFFAVMNALASDYGKVARKHGVDKVDFYADMAKAFMHDKDAVPDKVRVYYECIAKHDDD